MGRNRELSTNRAIKPCNFSIIVSIVAAWMPAVGMLRVISLVLSILAIACAPRQPWRMIALRVVEDTVPLRRTSEGIAFNVTAVLANRSPKPVYQGGRCAPGAEREIGGAWESVWSPVCVGPTPTRRLEPGDSLVIPVVVYGFSTPGREPRIDTRFRGGRYRIVLGLSFAPEPMRPYPSSVFVVLDTALHRDWRAGGAR